MATPSPWQRRIADVCSTSTRLPRCARNDSGAGRDCQCPHRVRGDNDRIKWVRVSLLPSRERVGVRAALQKTKKSSPLPTDNRHGTRCYNPSGFCDGKYAMEQNGRFNNSLGFLEDGVKIPTDYLINAEQALAYDHETASNYLRHTVIGDLYWTRY